MFADILMGVRIMGWTVHKEADSGNCEECCPLRRATEAREAKAKKMWQKCADDTGIPMSVAPNLGGRGKCSYCGELHSNVAYHESVCEKRKSKI